MRRNFKTERAATKKPSAPTNTERGFFFHFDPKDFVLQEDKGVVHSSQLVAILLHLLLQFLYLLLDVVYLDAYLLNVLLLDAYSAFGGPNGSIGAKDAYAIPVAEDVSAVALCRSGGEYEIVLEKKDGTWQRAEAGNIVEK